MIRAIFIFIVIGAIIFAAQWLLDRPGEVSISWQGFEVQESFAWGVAVLTMFLIGSLIVVWLLLTVLRSPWTIGKRVGQARKEKGQHAISLGMVAVAAGDREEARKQSKRAAKLVPDQPLATLLAAQSAQLDGDEKAAETYFTQLAETPDTAFLGLRGLWMQAMKDGRTHEALHFVERAHEEQPDAAWVLEAQLTLQARLGQWEAAAETLEKLAKRKLRTAEQARKARALINVERSRLAHEAGNVAGALEAAQIAYKADPTLVPAAAQLAKMHIANGRRGKAEKVIQDAWRTRPHPMLAEVYTGVVEKVEPEKQLDLARALAKLNRDARESQIMLARFAMAAEKWAEAERALEPSARRNPSVRICYLLAEIAADGRNDPETARDWLARSASAPPDEAWVCSETGAVQAQWSAVCAESQLFGTLQWRVPHHLPQTAPVALPSHARRPAPSAETITGPAGAANAPVVVDAVVDSVSAPARDPAAPENQAANDESGTSDTSEANVTSDKAEKKAN